jgi:hypothetical protein
VATQAATAPTRFGSPENGVVPHCSVLPRLLSHTTAASSMPRTAATSSAPAVRTENGVASYRVITRATASGRDCSWSMDPSSTLETMSNLVPAGKKAAELAVKHAPKAVAAWKVGGKAAAEQVKIQRARAANKKRAFEKARTLVDGTVLRQLHGEQAVWVVFAGEAPVAAYPQVEVELLDLVKHAKLSERQTPDEYDESRAKARAKRTAKKAGTAAREKVRRRP